MWYSCRRIYAVSASRVGYPFKTAHVVRPAYVLLHISEVVGKDGSGVVVVGAGVVVVVVGTGVVLVVVGRGVVVVVVGTGVVVVVVGMGVVVVVVVGLGVVVVVVGTGVVVVVVGTGVVEVVVGGVGVVKLTHCSLFLPKHHPDLSVIKKSGTLNFAHHASTVMPCTEFTLHDV